MEVKAKHCTWRGIEFEFTGYSLSDLLEALKSDNLSEREKQTLIFAWYMNSQLQQQK